MSFTLSQRKASTASLERQHKIAANLLTKNKQTSLKITSINCF